MVLHLNIYPETITHDALCSGLPRGQLSKLHLLSQGPMLLSVPPYRRLVVPRPGLNHDFISEVFEISTEQHPRRGASACGA